MIALLAGLALAANPYIVFEQCGTGDDEGDDIGNQYYGPASAILGPLMGGETSLSQVVLPTETCYDFACDAPADMGMSVMKCTAQFLVVIYVAPGGPRGYTLLQ